MNTPITIRQLSYALAVARWGGFSRASDHLNVSQSAISEQVRLLEDYLGVLIFKRSGAKIEVTDKGRALLEKAENVVGELRQLTDFARSIREDQRPSIRVGICSGLGARFATSSVRKLVDSFDDVRFEFSIATTERIHRLVSEDRMGLGITIQTSTDQLPMGLIQEVIGAAPMMVLLPSGHPVAAKKSALRIDDIVEHPIIMNELGIGYSTIVLDMFQATAQYPKIAAVSDNVELMVEMVAVGVGLAIVPKACVGSGARDQVMKRVEFRELDTDMQTNYTMVHRANLSVPRVKEVLAKLKSLPILN